MMPSEIAQTFFTMPDPVPHLLVLAQGASDAPPDKSLLTYISQGGEVGFIIIGLSLVAVGMIIAQVLTIRLSKLAPPEEVDVIRSHLQNRDVRSALQFCHNPDNDSLLTRIFGGSLERCARSPFGFLELKAAIEEIGQQQIAKLYRMTEGIGLIASIAPMLGLLGTVIGMVGAFDTISVTEGPVRPDALAGNISEALITTVLGLIVAIPTTAMYTYLRSRIDHLASEVGDTIESLAALIEPSQESAQPQAPARPPSPQPRQAAPVRPVPQAGNPG